MNDEETPKSPLSPNTTFVDASLDPREEAQRLEAKLILSERLSAVGALAAGVAHEINNPLAAVITNLEFVVHDLGRVASEIENVKMPRAELAQMVSAMAEALGDATSAAQRVRQIVRDLKVFSRATGSAKAPVDVRKVLDSALRMARNELSHRAVIARAFDEVPEVMIDEAKLGHALLNLIVNAAQSMPDGKRDKNELTVRTRTLASPSPGSAADPHAHAHARIVIEIVDSGPGIPPELAERVFEPFFTTKLVGGTGLGLSVARTILREAGGDVELVPNAPRGTIARVTLPALPPAVPATEESDAVVAPTLTAKPARARILIVDDEALVGNALRRLLDSEHRATAMTDANLAIAQLETGERYDVIFCDVMMPTMAASEFYESVQRIDPAQCARIVFMTGEAFVPSARAFLDSIPNTVIDKPFDAAIVRAAIARLL